MTSRTLHAVGPLAGTVTPPGDRRILLMTLALAMATGEPVRIENLPPESWYAPFLGFLRRYGASCDTCGERVSVFHGHAWPDEVTITAEVPPEVMHVVAATVIFGGGRAVFKGAAGDRATVTGQVLGLLAGWGLGRDHVTESEVDVIVEGAVPDDSGAVEASTGQAVEMALALALAADRPVTVSYAPQTASHIIKLAERLGCTIEALEPGGSLDRDHEITRRLARVKGGRALTTATVSWHSVLRGVIVLPGDAVMAAAIAGVAALVPRSKVTIREVVWEQDRRGFFETLKRMKGAVSWETAKRPSVFDAADVTVQWAPLEGVHVTAEQSLAMRPELMLLASVAAAATGTSVLSTDDGSVVPGRQACRLVAAGLSALGTHAGDFEVGIVLNGVPELRGSGLDAAGNPDAALALSVAALAAAGRTTLDGITPDMPYPDVFFAAIESVTTSSLPLS